MTGNPYNDNYFLPCALLLRLSWIRNWELSLIFFCNPLIKSLIKRASDFSTRLETNKETRITIKEHWKENFKGNFLEQSTPHWMINKIQIKISFGANCLDVFVNWTLASFSCPNQPRTALSFLRRNKNKKREK